MTQFKSDADGMLEDHIGMKAERFIMEAVVQLFAAVIDPENPITLNGCFEWAEDIWKMSVERYSQIDD